MYIYIDIASDIYIRIDMARGREMYIDIVRRGERERERSVKQGSISRVLPGLRSQELIRLVLDTLDFVHVRVADG